MKHSQHLWWVSGVVLAVLPATGSAEHAWSDYHWERSSNPVSLILGDNLTSEDWQESLSLASLDWNTPQGGYSQVLYTSVAPGAAKNSQCRPQTGSIEVCNDRYGLNGWLGIAQIWVEGSHIVKGAVKVNDTYYNDVPPYNDTGDKAAWQRYVMCQEVGHIFGLGHQDEDFSTSLKSCMDYSTAVYDNQSPNAHDFEVLAQLYSHLDGEEGSSGGPPAWAGPQKGEPDDLHDPRQWGRLMSSTHSGRTQIFEHEVARGKSLVTFVLWAR